MKHEDRNGDTSKDSNNPVRGTGVCVCVRAHALVGALSVLLWCFGSPMVLAGPRSYNWPANLLAVLALSAEQPSYRAFTTWRVCDIIGDVNWRS